MIQVKEFLNYQDAQEYRINKWIQEQGDSIDIIDIKYSVGVLPISQYEGQEISGALIVYKLKKQA